VSDFRGELLARFRWIGGHADVLGLLGDGTFLADAGRTLAEPFADTGFTKRPSRPEASSSGRRSRWPPASASCPSGRPAPSIRARR